jgi:hypothetical protein
MIIDNIYNVPMYYLIVGNHIIDDLLYNSYIVDIQERRKVYYDHKMCKKAWESMHKSGALLKNKKYLEELFLNIACNMKNPSMLILRHYPSTFALFSRDIIRINAEMDTFYAITKVLSQSKLWSTYFFNENSVDYPSICLYPNSVFILKRG